MQTTVLQPQADVLPSADANGHSGLTRKLLGGASALALAVAAERGFTFVANMLAFRIGGPSSFGAYSLALTTANNIASYAGAGIGSTATRFGGGYAPSDPAYRTLTRALLVVSVSSAVLAFAVLFLTADIFASKLLHNPNLAPLLRWSAFCSGAMILVECIRGFLVGQRRFSALFVLSAVVGLGMLCALPLASHAGPTVMIAAQATIGILAATAVMLGARRFGFASRDVHQEVPPLFPMLRRIWSFGFVQLAGVAGLNAAGWWVTTLVARADISLEQMGFLAVASQIRNLVALVPGMLTQTSYAMLSDQGEQATGSDRVLLIGTFFATILSFGVAAVGIILVPWILPVLFHRPYGAGVLAVCLAMATAVAHMGSAPAAARLTIVSLKATGWINAIWALAVVALATQMVPHGGAAGAMGVYLAVHLVSLLLVLASLRYWDDLAPGMTILSLFTVGGGLGLGMLAWWRASHGNALSVTAVMVLFAMGFVGALYESGRSLRIVPPVGELIDILIRRMRPAMLQEVQQ